MKISTVREFRDNASGLLRSESPILITRRGKLAGVYFPWPEASLPLDFKKDLFSVLSSEVGREVRERGLTEDAVLGDFATWRKQRRETRSRR